MKERYLVIDDLAFSLHDYPIYVPIPASVKTDKAMITFTTRVYKDMMKLHCFEWYHAIEDVHISGFNVRNKFIYPIIST